MRSMLQDSRLDAIAGTPVFDTRAQGARSLDQGFTTNEPRTIYTCFVLHSPVAAGSVQNIQAYGTEPHTDATPNTFATLRVNGLSNGGQALCNRRTGGPGPISPMSGPGKHVAVWGMDANSRLFVAADSRPIVVDADVPMSLAHQRFNTTMSRFYYAPEFRSVMYRGLHTEQQRRAIQSYLFQYEGPLTQVTNLAPNPRVLGSRTGWGSAFGSGATGSTTMASDSDGSFARALWTAPSQSASGGSYFGRVTGVRGGVPHFTRARIRASIAQRIQFAAECYDSAGGRLATTYVGAAVTTTPNTWVDLSGAFTPPVGTVGVTVTAYAQAGGVNWPAGATLDMTNGFLAESSTALAFADGATPGWAWNGAENNSTSTGYGIPL